MNTKNKRKRDELSTKVADVTGYSYDYVRRVRNGEAKNGCIELALTELRLAEEEALKNIKETLKTPQDEQTSLFK